MNDKYSKINIPLLRKILPKQIAQDLVGVQPMFTNSIDSLEINETYVDENTVEFYCVTVPFDMGYTLQIIRGINAQPKYPLVDMTNWCIQTFGEQDSNVWILAFDYKFCFKKKEHRDWFLLTWL